MELSVNGTTLHAEVVGDGAPCLVPHGGPGTDSGRPGPLAGAARGHARPAHGVLGSPRARALRVGARRAVHAGPAGGGHGGRAARARPRPGRRARHQLGRVPRPHVRRAPPGLDPPARRRRGGGEPRVHAPRGDQRAAAGHAGAVGRLPVALGRLAPRRRELPAGLRDDPAALLPRQGPGGRRERGPRRHALPDRRPAVRHRRTSTARTTAAPSWRRSAARPSSWWGATTGSARSTRPRRSTG